MPISASVGAAGQNRRFDVEAVQRLLMRHGMNPGPVDGRCGPRTVGAILSFQAGFLARPDGRVDPGGATWHHLAGAPLATPARRSSHQGTEVVPNNPLTTLVPRPARESINQGLQAVSPRFMVEQLGAPRESYSSDCQPMTNALLRGHVVTQHLGRFNVTGLRPAVESLCAALTDVQREQTGVYNILGTAGMLCCRYVRGSTTAISNHSWGTAIDFTLNGILDRRGDDRVQLGLTLIASILNRHGWYWGAAFRTEDAMHFEASRTLVTQWAPTVR